jgi:Protein of unknown function (DUF1194)
MISGDGDNNSGREPAAARDVAIAKGITINGLVILTEPPSHSYSSHTKPSGRACKLLSQHVIGGAGAFVVVAENFNSFGNAITKKLIAEIAQAEPQQQQEGSSRGGGERIWRRPAFDFESTSGTPKASPMFAANQRWATGPPP